MSKSFWTTLATYCTELAPVSGPLLSAVADTAHAVDRAATQRTTLRASARTLETLLANDTDL
jgi:hypothetical protein